MQFSAEMLSLGVAASGKRGYLPGSADEVVPAPDAVPAKGHLLGEKVLVLFPEQRLYMRFLETLEFAGRLPVSRFFCAEI